MFSLVTRKQNKIYKTKFPASIIPWLCAAGTSIPALPSPNCLASPSTTFLGGRIFAAALLITYIIAHLKYAIFNCLYQWYFCLKRNRFLYLLRED